MENIEETTAQAKPSTHCSFPTNNDEFVGFEEDVENLIQKLIGSSGTKERDVISIVGVAGLGKTTLASKVYSNWRVVDHFPVRAFCTVSQTYDVRKQCAEILKQVTGEKGDINEDDDILDDLRKALRRKRYLVVLDDIWNIEAWEDLQLCFPEDQTGSRIMVTTRFQQVAKQFSDPYSLRFLTDEESWELLQKKVFRSESCPSELCDAGFQVSKICEGLPLAIVVSAGILSQKERDASVWVEYAKDLSSHDPEEGIRNVLQLSYENLGNHLKYCLLYMGLFPEDYKVEVSDLLKLWIAEEFVQNVDTENLEKASNDCFNNLVNRCLLMVSEWSSNGDAKYCTIHDLVREFCLFMLKEEAFRQHIVTHQPRLCMYVNDMLLREMELNDYSLEGVKMLDFEEKESMEFIAHPQFYASNPMDLFPLLNSLRLIRVLHLLDPTLESSWEFQRSTASTLQSLTHLRYLAIFVKKFDFKWVSHLGNLQTLRVHSHQRIKTSPSIWKLAKLRHVDISEFSFIWDEQASLEESWQTKLENLKTFGKCRISMAEMNRKFWWRFPNLEELRLSIVYIHDMPNYSLFPTPEIHTRLQSLEINFPIGFSKSVGWFKSAFPSNLKVLSLAGILVTEEIISSIAALQYLERLKLFFIHFTCEPHWDVKDYHEFKALKYLKLKLVDMNRWSSSDTSFPALEKLVIKDCAQLEEIPFSFMDIPTLKLIKVINCSDSVGKSALDIRDEAEDIRNVTIQVLIPKNY